MCWGYHRPMIFMVVSILVADNLPLQYDIIDSNGQNGYRLVKKSTNTICHHSLGARILEKEDTILIT